MGKLSSIPKRITTVPNKLGSINSSSWRSTGKTGATARGYTYQWEQYRKRYLQQHPLCVYCEREGRVTAANVVDHIVPHQGDQELFWRLDNHQSLCTRHHNSDKQRLERDQGYR